MKAAGATNDKKSFCRLYVENRISLTAANAAWREGARFGDFVRNRDAEKATAHGARG
jgi:hypothetical protein